MLPRHLSSIVARNSISRRIASSSSLRIPLTTRPTRQIHSSAPRYNELPKSPFQTFVDVLRDELKKNRELQDNVKQLQGDVDKFQDSEAMKRARAAYERARVRQTPLLSLLYFANHSRSSHLVSKKTHVFELQPRSSKRPESKSATRSVKP